MIKIPPILKGEGISELKIIKIKKEKVSMYKFNFFIVIPKFLNSQTKNPIPPRRKKIKSSFSCEYIGSIKTQIIDNRNIPAQILFINIYTFKKIS